MTTAIDTELYRAFVGRVRDNLRLVKRTPRTWVRQIIGGGRNTETCPDWCTAYHGVDILGMFDDLTHIGDGTEMFLNTFDHWSDHTPVTLPFPVLRADIRVDPYSERPERNIPYSTFEPFQDEVMDPLGPDELAAVIAQVREHCDRLDRVVTKLRAARASWTTNGGAL